MSDPPSSRHGAEYWNLIADWYSGAYDDKWSNQENRWVQTLLRSTLSLESDGLVVDVGTGQGLAVALLGRHECKIVGVDTSARMLGHFPRGPQAFAVLADATCLPLSDRSASSAISLFSSLSYLPDLDESVSEISRVLRDESPFVIMLLGRFSLERLVRFEFSRTGEYGTYGAPVTGARVRFYSPRVVKVFEANGLLVERVVGLSPWRVRGFGHKTAWLIGLVVGRLCPALCHSIVIVGRRMVRDPDSGIRS